MTLDEGGTIRSVESCADPDRSAGVEFYAGILMPGMIDAHCHLELSYLRGRIEPGGGAAAFCRSVAALRDCETARTRIRAAAFEDARMWREGIDAVGDTANGTTAFPIKARSPIRYRTFAECFGLRTETAQALTPMLAYPDTSLTPHSTYALADRPFREICRTGDAPLSIHFLESSAENELFAGRGALHEWYASRGWSCDFLGYGLPVERIVACIPPRRSVILVHACCVTQRDIDRIMNHFTAPVRWCLCPSSNRYISRTTPPAELLRANRLDICIGTDSAASGSTTLIDELRLLGPEIPLEESLGWATAGGAAALGMDDDLGRIEPGRRCGIVLLTGVDYTTMKLTERARTRRLV